MQSSTPLAAHVYSDAFLAHDMPGHPENARRLQAAMRLLQRLDVLPHLPALPLAPATEDDIALVHDRHYLSWLRQEAVDPPHMIDLNTYVSAGSYASAVAAVGGAIAAVRAVTTGEARRVVALLRPPGHHARPAAAYGFCLLNNVACAAAWALEHLGLQRILVFDFDVHHGNGTQEAFWRDPRVLYVSLHESPLFPMSGAATERGEGAGAGYTINVPLPANSGDATYTACLSEILLPAARAYRPQLLLISAGFDAHWRDPLAHMSVTAAGFSAMVHTLIALAEELTEGRVAFYLEGGYEPAVLAACVANLCATVAGLPLPLQDPAGPPAYAQGDDLQRVSRLAAALGLRG
ncbi:MAG: histone deacetylase family protein [Anaerolineae bacterium]